MDSLKNLLSKTQGFVRYDIWRVRRLELPPGKSFFVKLLRVLILSIRGFDEDRCQLRASALTFYTLISIVPVAAMAFGIAKGFGFEKILESQLREKLAGHEAVFNNIVQFSSSLLENTKGGLLAGIGLVVLFWAVIKVLRQIEESLNDIWGVKEQRSIGRMFGDYLSIMLVCPVLILLSSSVTVFITASVTSIMEKISLLGVFSPLIMLLLEVLPYGLLWGLFTFLYVFMPNTKVRLSSGLIAGIVAGTVFHLAQWAYIAFQIGAARYNAIYGSFAALPLFLVWLQLSWLVVLYGAELSFAHQNEDTYEFEPDARQASRRLRMLLALQIASFVIKGFAAGQSPPTARQISTALEIPIRLVNDLLFDLVKGGVLIGTATDPSDERGFQPARDIHVLTVQEVMEALDRTGLNTVPFGSTPVFESLNEAMASFGAAVANLPANKPLKDL